MDARVERSNPQRHVGTGVRILVVMDARVEQDVVDIMADWKDRSESLL